MLIHGGGHLTGRPLLGRVRGGYSLQQTMTTVISGEHEQKLQHTSQDPDGVVVIHGPWEDKKDR